MTWFEMTSNEAADLTTGWMEYIDDEYTGQLYLPVVSDSFINPKQVYGIRDNGYVAIMWLAYGETLDVVRVVPAPWLIDNPDAFCAAVYAAAMISLDELPARTLRIRTVTDETKSFARSYRDHMRSHTIGDVAVMYDGEWLSIKQP